MAIIDVLIDCASPFFMKRFETYLRIIQFENFINLIKYFRISPLAKRQKLESPCPSVSGVQPEIAMKAISKVRDKY